MPRFAVYRNPNAATRAHYPLLLDIQSDLLDPLATRVVVPLSPADASISRAMGTLTPTLRFEGVDYVMLAPQVAGIATRALGPMVGDLSADRATIMAAVDFLTAGI